MLRTDFRVLVDGGANVSTITAPPAERLKLQFKPCNMRVATSSDGANHLASLGTVGPVKFVYGAGSEHQLEVWRHLFVVPDAGPKQIFEILLGNQDWQRYSAIVDLARGSYTLRPAFAEAELRAPFIRLPLTLLVNLHSGGIWGGVDGGT